MTFFVYDVFQLIVYVHIRYLIRYIIFKMIIIDYTLYIYIILAVKECVVDTI